MIRKSVTPIVTLLLALSAGGAAGQIGAPTNEPEAVQPLSLSGPRFGLTYLSPGVEARAESEAGSGIAPVVTQFGWQWEKRFFSLESGPTGVSEWVLLAGGLEQGVFFPSLTWIVGLRSRNGAEFGVGPNATPAGVALALAGGVTVQSGPIFFPFNVAVVPSQSGVRISVLAGFNMRRGSASASAVRSP